MFTGFSDRTFEFFMAIRFNNNREFFQSNHDWYVEAVREPCLALAEALYPVVHDLDPGLETRPQKVVSRINRDIRFSKDKSPYRDYMWLGFRRPGDEKHNTLGVYFDISDQGADYGFGFYNDNKPLMNALRRRILREPEVFAPLAETACQGYTFHPNTIKRLAIPDAVPEALRAWYALRGFYFERELDDFALLRSPELVNEIAAGYRQIQPLYQYILALAPEEDGIDEGKR